MCVGVPTFWESRQQGRLGLDTVTSPQKIKMLTLERRCKLLLSYIIFIPALLFVWNEISDWVEILTLRDISVYVRRKYYSMLLIYFA